MESESRQAVLVINLRAVHLEDDRAYLRWARLPPFVARVPTGPVMCEVGWCASYADQRSGETVMHREWQRNSVTGVQELTPVWRETPARCVVHRQWPGFQPKRFTTTGPISGYNVRALKRADWKLTQQVRMVA